MFGGRAFGILGDAVESLMLSFFFSALERKKNLNLLLDLDSTTRSKNSLSSAGRGPAPPREGGPDSAARA